MSKKTFTLLFIIASELILLAYFEIFDFKTNSDQLSRLTVLFYIISSIVGFLLLLVTLFYLFETRKSVAELKKQRENLESPAVTVRIVPDKIHKHLLNVLIRNTGNWPAYNVNINFTPDLPYYKTTLNNLPVFNNLPVLEKGESIELFFESAIDYFSSINPKKTKIKIDYFNSPKISVENDRKHFSIEYEENI